MSQKSSPWLMCNKSSRVSVTVKPLIEPSKERNSPESQQLLYLVVRDAAVNLGRLGGVDDDEGQLDGRVGRGRAALHLLPLLVPLDEVLEGDLLKKSKLELKLLTLG